MGEGGIQLDESRSRRSASVLQFSPANVTHSPLPPPASRSLAANITLDRHGKNNPFAHFPPGFLPLPAPDYWRSPTGAKYTVLPSWRAAGSSRSSNLEEDRACESPTVILDQVNGQLGGSCRDPLACKRQEQQKPLKELSDNVVVAEVYNETRKGLPLLQVWPSDSPRADSDEQGQVFVFPDTQENINDSGIESTQASPSPCGVICNSPLTTPLQSRRTSLLHPDDARLHLPYLHHNHHNIGLRSPPSPDRTSVDEDQEGRPPSPSNSTTSSLRSMPSSAIVSIQQDLQDRRRSSGYSTFDALDLEYALLRAAARGSVGPYSLSESLHKLTFTQSLAFPALARSLAAKQSMSTRSQQPTESGLNTIAKVVTAMVLMLVSILVFGVVYKFTKT
nr:PREDICTED: uncharacterized protein LOC105678382 [Linepithema humile]